MLTWVFPVFYRMCVMLGIAGRCCNYLCMDLMFLLSQNYIRILNLIITLTLKVTYPAVTAKHPLNIKTYSAGRAERRGERRLTKPVSAKLVICRMVSHFAESILAAIRSSSRFAAVHTAGERRQCFQIPDSLHQPLFVELIYPLDNRIISF